MALRARVFHGQTTPHQAGPYKLELSAPLTGLNKKF